MQAGRGADRMANNSKLLLTSHPAQYKLINQKKPVYQVEMFQHGPQELYNLTFQLWAFGEQREEPEQEEIDNWQRQKSVVEKLDNICILNI